MPSLYSLLFALNGLSVSVLGHNIGASFAPSNRASCEQTCDKLATQFGNRVHYYDDDTGFAIWDQKQEETVYACRVEPTSAQEVSQIVQILVEDWCRFAVKCGGHSRFPDDSVSVGGVTIDLGRMNTTVVSEDSTTAKIGGGATSRQVFAALDPYGLAYVGGRVGQVGMGGFTLGGGTSVVAPKHGWALDNVFQYEVVLANATIVNVSQTQHPDLYYALRGGGNNFGIVTSFTAGVFPQSPVYTGFRVFGDNQTDRFLEEAERLFTIEDSNDNNVVLEYTYSYSSSQNCYSMSSTQRYAQPILNPPIFDALNRIPGETALAGGINSLANSTRGGGGLGTTRNVFTTITHYPSVDLGKRVIGIYKEEVQKVRNVTGLSAQWITYSIPATAVRNMKLRGGNALGIDVKGHLILNLLAVGWTRPQDDSVAYTFANTFIHRFEKAAKDLGVLHPYLYINYANKGQDVFSGYGEKNKQRLISIQKAVDPQGVFTSRGLWPGFFKLL